MATYSRIVGTGSYLPEKVLTNADLEKMVDTNDEWIVSRSGIRERHIAADGETTGDLAFHAATRALEAAGLAGSDVELIVLGTTTPDIIFPSTANMNQIHEKRAVIKNHAALLSFAILVTSFR